MTDEDREVVAFRLQRAHETIEEARILAESGATSGTTNRLYYACFYAVIALLRTEGLSSSKHSGVRGLFNKHFVHPGIVSKVLAQLYNDVYEKRQDVDYMDLFRLDSTVVGALLPRAESFVLAIEELVRARCSAEPD